MDKAGKMAAGTSAGFAGSHKQLHVWTVSQVEVAHMQVLREDVEASLAEASLAQERTALLALEQEELQRQRDHLTGDQQKRASTV